MILVTGGAGFIGSNLVAALEARGEHEIVICDRLGNADKWRNIAKREIAGLIPPEGLFDFIADQDMIERLDAIFHLGAVSATTETDGDLVARTNFDLSLCLWEFCAFNRIRLIYASSAATYGDGAAGFDDSGSIKHLARLRPLNLYGWSKHAFDRRVARLLANGDPAPPQWAGLKFFNVYGPNEYHKGAMRSVVAQLYPKLAAGEPAQLVKSHNPKYEDGGQMRDFVWVGDAVDIMLWLYDNQKVSGLFNVGTGTARTFKDLATAVFSAVDRDPDIAYVDTPEDIRDKYQYFTEAKMGRLQKAGYDKPFTSLEDGVRTYVKDYLGKDDMYA